MNTTKQSLMNNFELVFIDGNGEEHAYSGSRLESLFKLFEQPSEVNSQYYWRFNFGDQEKYSLRIEPLLQEDQHYLALYKDGDSIIDKVCIKFGYVKKQKEISPEELAEGGRAA